MDKKKLFLKTGGHCFYCGCNLDVYDYHADHVLPVSKGGKFKNNIVPCCADCNRVKGHKTLEEFKGRLYEIPFTEQSCRISRKYYPFDPFREIVFWFEENEYEGVIDEADAYIERCRNAEE